ncbi:conserved virulence factor C family protein [Psychrobacillus sp. BL-248-WT-3]|uniref:conserved virulence factor C family protein n=1 Tax=Psychrobacillus sp. BL-248-WT-3 TaxID=2725306 RepID=UPI00146CF2DE|nr:conserved virulence factor C family protein [Psychrobacillus sp. BL-248-WT-3]NME06413.1 virulence factor [Psychrobacillus sp. BL-248-WT-3]
MKILTIEPTPSPNTMKVVVDQELPFGKSYNYKKDHIEDAPKEIQRIFDIEGVKGVYHVADFLAIERIAKFSWESILASIENVFGGENEAETEEKPLDHYGEVYVHVQSFKGIPLQVKVFDSESESRFGLSARFTKALDEAMEGDKENYIMLRKWVDYGVRYGDQKEIGEQLVKELEASFPQSKLEQLIADKDKAEDDRKPIRVPFTLEEFEISEWEKRFQLLDNLINPQVEDIPVLAKAIQDEQVSIRRLATVYLGLIEDEKVIPYLEMALKDKSASVRRTAGDAMSDLGFVQFSKAMEEALFDKNKLVRWRAAMYFYEVGDMDALPALKKAMDDKEYEVKLQIRMAIARIAEGEEAKGSVWKQMSEARK